MDHPSSSDAQQLAENEIRRALSDALKLKLRKQTLFLPGGSRVDFDGVDDARTCFVEIYSKQGKLKGAQPERSQWTP